MTWVRRGLGFSVMAVATTLLAPTPSMCAERESAAPMPAEASTAGATDQADTIVERVEVTSDGSPVDVTVASTHLSGADLQQRGWDLADLLRRVPGARVRDYGGLGSYATLSLRASTSEQISVTVDGIPQNSALGGGVDLGRFPSARIESVRVYRGFAPVGLGLGGIGGAIDIRTRAPVPDGGGSAELLVGELGTVRVSAIASLPIGRRAIEFGVEGLDGNGDFAFLDDGGTLFDPADDRTRHRANQQIEQRSLWMRGDQERWSWNALASIRRQGVEPPVRRADPTALLSDDRLEFTGSWVGTGGRLADNIRIEAGARSLRSRFSDRAGDFLFPQDRTTQTHGYHLAATASWIARAVPISLRIQSGWENIEIHDSVLERADRGGARRMDAAATTEAIFRPGDWTVAPSLRVDFHEDRFLAGAAGLVPPPADNLRRAGLSGKIGLRRRLSVHQQLIGSVGRTYRRPNLLELFGDRGAVRGSPELVPETARGAELGWAWEVRDASRFHGVSIVAFARRTKDMIRFVPASQAVSVALNLSRVDVVGVEAVASWKPLSFLAADLSVTRQQARERFAPQSPARRLVYQPDWLGSLNLSATHHRFRAHWDLTYTGENSTDTLDTPSDRVPQRWIHDANLVLPLGHGVEASLDVRNVFDRRTLDVLRYPLPGRVVLAGLRWSDHGRNP